MIDFIKGKVVQKTLEYVIVENSGMGYKLLVSQNTSQNLNLDEDYTVYTKLIVREDDMLLVGFYDISERDMFELLMSVSKVGLKTALNVLSLYTPSKIAYFITTGDVNALSKVSGVAKKTSEMLILQLKDKVKNIAVDNNVASDIVKPVATKHQSQDEDAVEALISLGFTLKEAQYAIDKVLEHGEVSTTEEIIKKSFAYLR